MIPEGNAEPGGQKKEEKQPDLKEIKPVVPDIQGCCSESQKKCAAQKQQIAPANFAPFSFHKLLIQIQSLKGRVESPRKQ